MAVARAAGSLSCLRTDDTCGQADPHLGYAGAQDVSGRLGGHPAELDGMPSVLARMALAPQYPGGNHRCPDCSSPEGESEALGDGFRRCRVCLYDWNVVDSDSWDTHRVTGEQYVTSEVRNDG